MQRTYLVLVFSLLLPLAAHAEEPGDKLAGLAFARRNCTECHAVVAGAQYSPNIKAPTFEAVARTAGMTGRALAVWLQTSHPSMPNIIIGTEDRDNVIAYVLSLRSQPAK